MANVVGEMSCTLAEAPNREAISADNCVDGTSVRGVRSPSTLSLTGSRLGIQRPKRWSHGESDT